MKKKVTYETMLAFLIDNVNAARLTKELSKGLFGEPSEKEEYYLDGRIHAAEITLKMFKEYFGNERSS